MHINQKRSRNAANCRCDKLKGEIIMKKKKITSILLASALSVGCAFAMTACDDSSSTGNDSALLDEIAKLEQQLSDVQKDLSDLKKANETPAEDTVWNFGAESYEKLKYIDALYFKDYFAEYEFPKV